MYILYQTYARSRTYGRSVGFYDRGPVKSRTAIFDLLLTPESQLPVFQLFRYVGIHRIHIIFTSIIMYVA